MKVEEIHGALIITDFNQIEAYKIACKIEKDGIEFYKSLLESVGEEDAREEIKFLLREEINHLKFFEHRLDELRQNIEDGFEEDDLFNYLDYEVFEPYRQAREMIADKINNAEKALRLGILIEERAVNFYQACSEQISSLVKDVVVNIMKEEERHKSILEKMLNNSAKK
ncbi:MAG: ferritin family protein [Candidatus Omnitrophota bacterium]